MKLIDAMTTLHSLYRMYRAHGHSIKHSAMRAWETLRRDYGG